MMSEKARAHADMMVDDAKRRRAMALAKKREKIMVLSVELTEVRARREEFLLKERELQRELDLLLEGGIDGLPQA